MTFLQKLGSYFSQKQSDTRIVTTIQQVGRAQHTPANYENFAKYGYSKNLIVYVAISKIATSCAGIEWCLYKKPKTRKGKKVEIEDHPLLTLMRKPNPEMGLATFTENVVAYKEITGNSYIEFNNGVFVNQKTPLEMWPVRPDKMKIVPGPTGYVLRYEYTSGGITKDFEVDQKTLKSNILHWKSFNPLNFWYGLSPIEAAMLSLDQNTAGQKWNLALLQNSATPSGVLQMKVTDINPRGSLTQEQYERVKGEFDENFQGAKNAGRPLILEGGLEWKQISLSTKDMDFINNKNVTATDIFAVYGVPPELVGLGQKTFNNYKEARLAFYEDKCLPIMDSLEDKYNQDLVPRFEEEGLCLEYDKDDIEALVEKRETKYTSLSTATFLSENEKRVSAGYEEQPGLDIWKIGNASVSKAELEASVDSNAPDTTNTLDSGQVTSMLEVISQVATGKIPRETGLEILKLSFNLNDEQADTILNDVGNGFKPSADNTNASSNTPQNKPPQESPTVESNPTEANTDPNEQDPTIDTEKSFKSINLLNRNEKLGSWAQQNKKRERLAKSFERELHEDFKDLVDKLSNSANNLQNADPKLLEYALIKDVSDFTPTLFKTLSRHMKYTLYDFGSNIFNEAKSLSLVSETKANLDFDSFVNSYIKKRVGPTITTINSTNEKQIKRIVKEWTAQAAQDGDTVEDLSFYLQTEFSDLTKSNAARIARTEVAIASNNGMLEAVKSLQVPGMTKEWISANDSRVRNGGANGLGPDHASVDDDNGEIPVDDMFKVNPDVMMTGPGDTGAPADQVINCRCVLVFKNKG